LNQAERATAGAAHPRSGAWGLLGHVEDEDTFFDTWSKIREERELVTFISEIDLKKQTNGWRN